MSFIKIDNEKQRKEVIENVPKKREILKSGQLERKIGKQVLEEEVEQQQKPIVRKLEEQQQLVNQK